MSAQLLISRRVASCLRYGQHRDQGCLASVTETAGAAQVSGGGFWARLGLQIIMATEGLGHSMGSRGCC